MSRCNCCNDENSTPVFEFNTYKLVSCNTCQLVYIQNPPTQDSIQELYTAPDQDYHTELRDKTSLHYRRIARCAAEHLAFVRKVAKEGMLVDIGCSTGQFLGLAADNGFECAGIELARNSAKFAAQETGLPIETGSIHDTKHASDSCDVVTMFDVIEHVPDPSRDIAEAYRLLKPGGWLIMSTPNIDGLFPRASYGLASKLNYWPHPEPPHHLYQFSVNTMTAMLENGGFEVGAVEHHNIDLAYTFGAPSTLMRMPKRLAYAAVFAPLAKLGPLVGQGDWFYVAAQKPKVPAMRRVAA